MKSSFLAAVFPLCLLSGCHSGGSGASGGGSGRELSTLAEIGVGCPSAKTAKLTLAGDPIAVGMACTEKSGSIDVKLSAHDAVFEEEHYRVTSDELQLLGAAGEQYQPAVVLVKTPMHVGDTWTWTGSMMAGTVSHAAKATISTAMDHLFLPVPGDALRVQVDFEIDGGGSKPYKKGLTFWIEPKLGIIRRKFGDSSLREPAGP